MKSPQRSPSGQPALNPPNLLQSTFVPGDVIPNSRLPLILLRDIFAERTGDPVLFERLFASNRWGGSWRNGIYTFHHYHSTAHEVLGVVRGGAQVQFGGERGSVYQLEAGDVVVIPAGVGHKNLGATAGFQVVGAYPEGQEADLCEGKRGARPKADQNILRVPLPARDPVYGLNGPLLETWRSKLDNATPEQS